MFAITAPDLMATLTYEIVGVVFIILFGSSLHFTFDKSGQNRAVGVISPVNESVWEHLKLAFWPSVIYAAIGFGFLNGSGGSFLFGEVVGTCLILIIIPVVFYSYTAFTRGKCVLAVDIASFVVAVIVGQFASFNFLSYNLLPQSLSLLGFAVMVLLAAVFALFTFHPPRLPIFRDSVTGKYGIPRQKQ